MGVFLKFLIFFLLLSTHAFARDLDKLYKKTDFKIGAQKFTAYIADDEGGRENGLMFIEKIPENTGMLFVFEEERPLNFWMKNTLIPLSIGFFDHQGVLIDIQEMRTAIMELKPPTYPSKGPALFALEMNPGWFEKHGIKIGSRLERPMKSPSALLNRELPLPKATRH
jgi:uncharacterized protein